jgi:hypothetical protein
MRVRDLENLYTDHERVFLYGKLTSKKFGRDRKRRDLGRDASIGDV